MRRNITIFILLITVSCVLVLLFENGPSEIGYAPVFAGDSSNVHMKDPGTVRYIVFYFLTYKGYSYKKT